MKKTIVTGGAGFIGSHTWVELLAAGFEPIIVDDLRNSEERVLEGLEKISGHKPVIHRVDCCDAEALDRVFAAERPSSVIHFAADKAVNESVRDPLKYYHNNIGSLATLLRVMDTHQVKNIVFSSSCTVYGNSGHSPVTEDLPPGEAASPYGYTKMVCEHMLRDTVASDAGLRAVLLRYFNPVGAHPSALIGELPIGVPSNLVPYMTQAAAGLRDRLTVFGDDYDTRDGSCIRDYIHVVDLAKAHVLALQWAAKQHPPFCEVFNLGTGKGNTVLEAVHTFEQENGVKVPFVIGPRREGDVPVMFADTTKSRKVLGWQTKLTLADALRDAWRWQQALG
ncbi:MAG TPA: UDP-glucose 4-epimerase GalE [Flavobacteriales bacterium]|nr:UDP-glucose 4-epimerase GalE [Flavobacteriales bacterium]HRN35874.1 UDP-glucose 4-epimerase GalE [Flavobacteriales bacterium]HRO40002.1 UDP-glucose 4-epimerase GalE [Flavobacteriales bacterium]HRP80942.1 UDP-glucose 4-epimerase GalE [Flavobacteriales bacterium]HRQ84685.1 UDP-glucose 4-epimerase GalE [Flavobacteriales bacterium]